MKQFNAPWGKEVKLSTGFASFVLIGVALIGINFSPQNPFIKGSVILIPVALLVGSAAFMVRGYVLNGRTLIVERLGWSSTVDLSNLISATPDSEAMKASIRLAGNGGLFGFSGLFRNSKLGNYRVFGTDPKQSVVLRFANRTVVVTPEHPEKFAEEIAAAK